MKLISPTGKGIRLDDDWGSGLFGAPRGSGYHYGTDFICEPGKPVFAPVTPISFGPSKPYADNPEYGGIQFEMQWCFIELWYIVLHRWVSDPRAKAFVKQGMEIGICQDIREKVSTSTGKPFGDRMIPHLHLQIRLNPYHILPQGDRVFINPEDWL